MQLYVLAYTAAAVSAGTTFLDGTPEAQVTLAAAKKLRNRLLQKGYDVLMIRDSEDVQLDNIARTVLANNNADCHIALHWDSTENDKGAFFMGVPDIASYRLMEPVASHWEEHELLGECLITGLEKGGIKIFSEGMLGIFVVIGLLTLAVSVMGKLSHKEDHESHIDA